VTNARTEKHGTVIVIKVNIEQGREGLLYATSPDLKGLFVAAATVDELDDEIPRVIKVLLQEQTGGDGRWEVWPASQGGAPGHIPHMWAAVPPHIAAAVLGNETSQGHS
jgi:hypothetical protein